MNFFVVDSSAEVRKIVRDVIIEDNLGIVTEEAEDGCEVYADQLPKKRIKILVIDQTFPNRSGIDTVREIAPYFNGKIVMLSEGSEEEITQAYSLGVEYCIRKPIIKTELSFILQKLIKQITLENMLEGFSNSLDLFHFEKKKKLVTPSPYTRNSIVQIGKTVLMELGIIGESGNKDLLDILYVLYTSEKNGRCGTPSLKTIYEDVIRTRFSSREAELTDELLKKEIKSCEQRIRRVLHQALNHVASMGLTDYTNPKFENLATCFFDYDQVRKRMLEIEGKQNSNQSYQQINIRKFVLAVYLTAKQKRNEALNQKTW